MPKPNKQHDCKPEDYVKESLSTGIFEWQELAQLDFQELISIARKKNTFPELKDFSDQTDFF